MSKHAPEPWVLRGDGLTIQRKETGKLIARFAVPPKRVDGDRMITCVNALSGLNHEAVKDVLEALRLFLECASYAEHKMTCYEKCEIARAALARLEASHE